MADPALPNSKSILPVPLPYRRPQEAGVFSSFQATTPPAADITEVGASATITEETRRESPPETQQDNIQQQLGGSPVERDWPANVAVVRGEGQGLDMGLFCPLCLGDLYQFLVTENGGFVMCPNPQCAYPFNLPREELQSHFTAMPNIDFGSVEKKGKGRGASKIG